MRSHQPDILAAEDIAMLQIGYADVHAGKSAWLKVTVLEGELVKAVGRVIDI